MIRRLSYKDLTKINIEIYFHMLDDRIVIYEYPEDEEKILEHIQKDQTNINYISFVLINDIHKMKFDVQIENNIRYWKHDTSHIHTQIYEYVKNILRSRHKLDKQIRITNYIYRKYILTNNIRLAEDDFMEMFKSGNFVVLDRPTLTNETMYTYLDEALKVIV
jgi:hypothetical protein